MGFFDKMKNMIGIEDQYDEEDYPDGYDYNESSYDTSYDKSYDAEDSNEEEYTATSTNDYSTSAYESNTRNTTSRVGNVIDMSKAGAGRMRISIQEPLEYDDGPKVLDSIAQGRSVVLNLEMLEVDNKRQIFDFVSGGVYALHGNIQKVTKDIYVIVPKGVDIDATVKESASESSMYQL